VARAQSPGRALHDALGGPQVAVMVAVFDGLSAQLVERAGFRLASLGGSTVSNTLLGAPDAGFVNLTDMEYVLRRTLSGVSIPVVVDVDNGYGNATNVLHTVRTLESAGAAGIMMEDQVQPPRNPGSGGTAVIPCAEMIGKVKAALDSRRDRDFFVIARTDAYSVEGLDPAIERANQYAEAGADCTFVTGYLSTEQLSRVGREVAAPHRLTSFGGHSGGRYIAHDLTLEQLGEMGFGIATAGVQLVAAAALGMLRYLEGLAARGIRADRELREQLAGTPMGEWLDFTGFRELQAAAARYVPEGAHR
jgi:2-methylisocitrate lyase-like PEP mutase family enzyme